MMNDIQEETELSNEISVAVSVYGMDIDRVSWIFLFLQCSLDVAINLLRIPKESCANLLYSTAIVITKLF